MHGATVCIMHGGAAPQVKRKAQERLLEIRDLAAARFVEQLGKDIVLPPTVLAAIRDMTETVERMQEREEARTSRNVVDDWLATLKKAPE